MEGKFTDEIFFQKLQEGDPGKLKEFFNDSFALFVLPVIIWDRTIRVRMLYKIHL